MKVLSSVKGRGKKLTRKGRMAQGYFVRRGGVLYFYNYDNSSLGARIKMRQPKSRRKKQVRKY